MAIHWQVKFKSLRQGEVYTVNIYDSSYYGTPVQLKGAEEPLVTQEDEDDDWFLPVRTQSGYIRIVDDGKDVNGSTLTSSDSWNKIIPAGDRSRKVTLTDSSGNVKWQGYIQPQTFSGRIYECVQEREFPIQCGLSVLKGVTPTVQSGLVTFAELLYNILYQSGLSFYYIYFSGEDAIYWLIKKVDWSNFIEIDGNGNRTSKYSYFDLLENICKFWGWTCRTFNDDVYFVSADEDFARDFIRMDMQGLYQLASGYTPYYNYRSYSYYDMDANIYASTDNQLEILRGMKKVTVRCNINKHDEILSVPFDEISALFRAASVGYTVHGNVYHFYKEYNNTYYSVTEYENGDVSIECYWDQGRINGRFIAFEDYDGDLADKHNYNFNYVLNAFGNNNSVDEACMKLVSKSVHSFNDGAITINANLLDAPDTANISAYLRVGDKCWNGSSWVSASSSVLFSISIKGNAIADNRALNGPYDAYRGYGVPVTSLGGIVDFRIVRCFDGAGGYTLNFTSVSLGFVKERAKALNNDHSENVYTSSTNSLFSDDRTVDLIFATNNLNGYGYGFVMDSDGTYTYDVPYSYSGDTEYERPEEHLLSRMKFHYSAVKKKETLDIRHDLVVLSPLYMCETAQMTGYPLSISHHWRDDVDRVVIVET